MVGQAEGQVEEGRIGSLGLVDANYYIRGAFKKKKKQVLLYSIGSYIQYHVIKQNGKKKKIYIYIYIYV